MLNLKIMCVNQNRTFVVWVSISYNKSRRWIAMKFIDLLDAEHATLMSRFLDRLDEKSCTELEHKSEKYVSLKEKADKLADENDFIYDFFERTNLSQKSYSKEQMQALKDYLEYQRQIDDYERMELYKTGIADCITLLSMVGIL